MLPRSPLTTVVGIQNRKRTFLRSDSANCVSVAPPPTCRMCIWEQREMTTWKSIFVHVRCKLNPLTLPRYTDVPPCCLPKRRHITYPTFRTLRECGHRAVPLAKQILDANSSAADLRMPLRVRHTLSKRQEVLCVSTSHLRGSR